MNILVTGGCGFIGSHVTEYYATRGHRVTVLDNLSAGDKVNLKSCSKKVRLVIGDIRNQSLLLRLIKESDVIVHLAAIASVPLSISDPQGSHEVNVQGSLNVLHAAMQSTKKPKVIFASSAAVYGIPKKLPLAETAPIAPISPYGVHKRVVEEYGCQYHRCFGLRFTALRFFNVFGPRQDPRSPYSGVISIFMQRAAEKKPATIYGTGQQTRDFVYVSDVVHMINRCIHSKKSDGQIYNVGTGQTTNLIKLWKTIAPNIKPKKAAERGGDIPKSQANIQKSQKELRYNPRVTLATGIRALRQASKN